MQKLNLLPTLFDALTLAAQVHQYQRRSGYDRLPYVNHLIKVTNTLITIGQETDQTLLTAAILHDAIEDTEATHDSIATQFGQQVADIVVELSDDMSLPYAKRKERQVQMAHQLSTPARKIRIADKACNIQDIFSYPLNWTAERKQLYVENSVTIVEQIRGTHPALERHFDQVVAWSREQG